LSLAGLVINLLLIHQWLRDMGMVMASSLLSVGIELKAMCVR
jgi:hypothetical protein